MLQTLTEKRDQHPQEGGGIVFQEIYPHTKTEWATKVGKVDKDVLEPKIWQGIAEKGLKKGPTNTGGDKGKLLSKEESSLEGPRTRHAV